MYKKNNENRLDRNDTGEEFTGFAWMREKKIHQKIGILFQVQIKWRIKFCFYIFYQYLLTLSI